YNASDSSSNAATQQSRTVTVDEHAALSVTNLPSNLTAECQGPCSGPSGAPATYGPIATFLAAPTRSDICDSDATISNDAPACFPLGVSTTVTWTVSDADGHAAFTATASRTVTVTDTLNPSITCPAAPDPISADVSCQATIPDLATGASASDQCSATVTKTQS